MAELSQARRTGMQEKANELQDRGLKLAQETWEALINSGVKEIVVIDAYGSGNHVSFNLEKFSILRQKEQLSVIWR